MVTSDSTAAPRPAQSADARAEQRSEERDHVREHDERPEHHQDARKNMMGSPRSAGSR